MSDICLCGENDSMCTEEENNLCEESEKLHLQAPMFDNRKLAVVKGVVKDVRDISSNTKLTSYQQFRISHWDFLSRDKTPPGTEIIIIPHSFPNLYGDRTIESYDNTESDTESDIESDTGDYNTRKKLEKLVLKYELTTFDVNKWPEIFSTYSVLEVRSIVFNNVIKHENRLLLEIQNKLFETSRKKDEELPRDVLFWKKHRDAISTFREVHQRDRCDTAGTCFLKKKYMNPIAAVVLVSKGRYIGHIYAGLESSTKLGFIGIRTSLQNYELCRSRDERCFHKVKKYLLQGVVQLARELKVVGVYVPIGLGIMGYWLSFYRDHENTKDRTDILKETFIEGGVPMVFSKSEFTFKYDGSLKRKNNNENSLNNKKYKT